MTIVAVGSVNRAKVVATRNAFARWCGDVKVVAFEVESGVPAQPVSEEVFDGALARARAAQAKALSSCVHPDYSVGMEAGTVKLWGRWCAWGAVCILDSTGRQGIGTTPAFELPSTVVALLEEGRELGDIVEEVAGDSAVRQQGGAVGLFTRGLLSREDLFEYGILAALACHVSPEWYLL